MNATEFAKSLSGLLPMGAEVLSVHVYEGNGVVLCFLPTNDITPFVTWTFTAGLDGFCTGMYRAERRSAKHDYVERVARAMGTV